jgi:hypothetical protein
MSCVGRHTTSIASGQIGGWLARGPAGWVGVAVGVAMEAPEAEASRRRLQRFAAGGFRTYSTGAARRHATRRPAAAGGSMPSNRTQHQSSH